MTTADLADFRRRFVHQLAEHEHEHEHVVRDRSGSAVERRRAVEVADADAGTFTIWPGFQFTGGRGDGVAVAVGLAELDAAWDRLVRWGADALACGSDEQNVSGSLTVLIDEATESSALKGADDVVLSRRGIFEPRRSRDAFLGVRERFWDRISEGRSVSVDLDGGGAFVSRTVGDGDLSTRFRVEVGIDSLSAAWGQLVVRGRHLFALAPDEENGLAQLELLLDEAEEEDLDLYVFGSEGMFAGRSSGVT